MAVIYLFNAAKELRRPVREGVQEIIHSEGEYTAVTQILARDAPEHGDYFGFKCMDGRFRLFLINTVEINDAAGTCMLTGTDAAIAELEGSVLTHLPLQNTTAAKAVSAALQGTGWTIGQQTGDGEVNIESAYFATRWTAIKNAAAAGGVRAIPYYEFSGNQITAKKVDLLDKTPVFSGLIYTRKRGAQNIHITREGIPYGRVYPIGKIIGSEEPPEQVTIADAVWSKANGDPVDKPAGQLWIALPDAISDAEYVFEDKKEEDPKRLMEKAYADLEKTSRPTASGTANISEMERIPGYEHMAAQMWMMAVIRTETGESVETSIINIDRYYVHTELTKITVGDEDSNEDMLENQLANLNSLLIDTAKVAGGGRAGAGKAEKMVLEATELIQLNSKRIEANADEIRLRATTARVDQLEDLTQVTFQEVYLDIDTTRALISATDQKVDNINNEVTGIAAELTVQADQIGQRAYQYEVDELGNRVATAESELIVQSEQISARVEKNGVIGAINLTTEEAVIDANRINLVGYVTMSAFEAEMAEIGNIFAGYSEIDALGISGNLYAQNVNFPGNVSLLGRTTSLVDLTMGDVASHTLYGAGTGTSLNLQHSHAVVINDDGTITLAEVSSSGGSFNVADTKAFKEAVSAASANVTLSSPGWVNGTNVVSASNGKSLTVELPDFSTSGGTSFDSDHKTTVYFSTPSVNVPLESVEVDAGSVYTSGYNSGYSSGQGAGYNTGYEAGKKAYNPTTITRTGYSTTNKTVTVKAANANQDLLTGIAINASEIYNAGYNAGYSAGNSAGYDSGYDAGWQAAFDAVTVGYSSFTITNTAANTFYARANIWARVNGTTAASATITKTQTINVGQ